MKSYIISYIIEVISLEIKTGRERPSDQFWHSTYTSLADAKAAYTSLAYDRRIIAQVLLSWMPGNIEPSGKPLAHGNHSQRQCDGGMPSLTVLAHADKLFIPPHHLGRNGVSTDLIAYAEKVDQTLKIGGGNNWRLTPRISNAWIGSDGRTLYNWPKDQPVPASLQLAH
jgi:hypothetical protein